MAATGITIGLVRAWTGFTALFIPLVLCALPMSNAFAAHLGKDDRTVTHTVLRAIDSNRAKTANATLRKISDPLLRKALQWLIYLEVPTGSTFDEIAQFILANPSWPRMSDLYERAESRMQPSLSASEVTAWFEDRKPVSTEGWIRLGAALLDLGRKDEAIAIFRKTWVNGSFTKMQERQFYRAYRRYLTREDHIDRLERLLWEGSYWPARRMFGKVNEDLRRLAEARFLLRHMRGNVDKAIDRVPAALIGHPGLEFERLRWRRKKGHDESAREILLSPPDDMIRPDLWFRERVILARRALGDGLISEAYRMIREHGLGAEDAANYADAEWLAGWIALRFLNEPAWAYEHFSNMHGAVAYPISVARAAYWSGRAAAALGHEELAKSWFQNAAGYFTTYYGQLAALKLTGDGSVSGVPLPVAPEVSADDMARFNAHELVAVSRTLAEADAKDWLRPIILHLFSLDESMAWAIQTASLAREVGRPDLAVRVAKLAERRAQYIFDGGYPILVPPKLPKRAEGDAIERPLVLALIRQESAFYSVARSGAGAMGMMQLMPATAKRVAKQVGLHYTKARLVNDPEFNLQVGQSYLAGLLKSFDGSYILSLAAYNAGPGRAKAWTKANGMPNDPEVDTIDWVESIPFDETRNYVQRVLENLQVYRSFLAKTEVALTLEQDLRR